jgi:hypothetical protein
MPSPANYLRTHVLQTSTERIPLFLTYFSQSEIGNPKVSFEINHYILRLQVAIEDVLGMQVFDG